MEELTKEQKQSAFLDRYRMWKLECEKVANIYEIPVKTFYLFLEMLFYVPKGNYDYRTVMEWVEFPEFMKMVEKKKLTRRAK